MKSRLGLEAMMSRFGLEALMSRLGRFGPRSSSVEYVWAHWDKRACYTCGINRVLVHLEHCDNEMDIRTIKVEQLGKKGLSMFGGQGHMGLGTFGHCGKCTPEQLENQAIRKPSI